MSASSSTSVPPSPLRDPSTTASSGSCVHADTRRDRLALTIGISGARRNAAVAACEGGVVTACCEQERLTRVRGIRLEPFELPSEAVAAVLRMAGNRRESDIAVYATAERDVQLPNGLQPTRVDHHEAHAASAFFMSSFRRAAVLICDRHTQPPTSVWIGSDNTLARQCWPSSAVGFAALYSACSEAFGFARGHEIRLESLARLDSGLEADRFKALIRYVDRNLIVSPTWLSFVSEWLAQGDGQHSVCHRARVASAFQHHLARLLLELVRDVRSDTGSPQVCLAGGLFFNTFFNTQIQQSGIFEDVFVAPNPGNAGLAPGAALAASDPDASRVPGEISPFLGPAYDVDEIKATLDNCKLSYDFASESGVIASTVDALAAGRLVGWFQGRMEWAHRALGNRSILANPFAPYVLENLNGYLKRRDCHTTYGLSLPQSATAELVVGPPRSRFMQYDYHLLDRDRFRHVLPEQVTALRVQTISEHDDSFRRYHQLHKAFGHKVGTPALVNTSFNGFAEPIVCSPRDAIRVFFGTGLDVLVLDRFILYK